MSEHTLGPWEIMQTERDLFVCGPDGLPLTHTRPANTVRANDHLIAAAPDLLDACKSGGRYTDESGPELLHKVADILAANSYDEFAIDLRIKADKEQNAIVKAQGEAND